LYGSVGVNNEYVFLPSSDGKITALRKREGTKAWEFQTSNGINTAPVATEKNIFFGTLDKNIFALDAKSGKIQWQYSLDGRLKTNLVAKNDCLVAFVEDRTVLVFKKPTNISKGK
jgi:outer membrane protein assembly factor BamB